MVHIHCWYRRGSSNYLAGYRAQMGIRPVSLTYFRVCAIADIQSNFSIRIPHTPTSLTNFARCLSYRGQYRRTVSIASLSLSHPGILCGWRGARTREDSAGRKALQGFFRICLEQSTQTQVNHPWHLEVPKSAAKAIASSSIGPSLSHWIVIWRGIGSSHVVIPKLRNQNWQRREMLPGSWRDGWIVPDTSVLAGTRQFWRHHLAV